MAPKLLKRRIILTLIYSAGLHRQEAVNLKITDIDKKPDGRYSLEALGWIMHEALKKE